MKDENTPTKKNLGKHHPSRGNTGSTAFKIRDKSEWPLDWRSWPEQATQKQQSETQGLEKKQRKLSLFANGMIIYVENPTVCRQINGNNNTVQQNFWKCDEPTNDNRFSLH